MFSGKTILVTGATSGIGAACARAFAREGARTVLTGRNAVAGETLRDSLPGDGHLFLAADLADREQAQHLVSKVIQRAGGLDVLVNNAGVVHHATVPETSDDCWDETLALNLNAVFYLCRAAIPAIIERGGGAIVNVASNWGVVGGEQVAAYCASKGALIQLTRAMALDHARDGLRVNAVAPGAVDTPMLEAEAAELGLSAEACRREWAESAPDRRLASTDDVAEAILFLASDRARHIHGSVLPVDGGSLAG